MNPTSKVHKAILVMLHRQYFLKTYTLGEAKYIDYCIERDDEELLEYEKKTNSYLVSISLYDFEYDKIKSDFTRIGFDQIKRIMNMASFKKRYQEAKKFEI